MKHHILRSAVIICALLFAGCVVRSVQPWFAPETRVTDPSPTGFWTDANASVAAFFTPIDENRYSVLLQNEKNATGQFIASLHRIDTHLFLVATAADRQDLGVFATVPAHLLFRVEWKANQFKLFPINLKDFNLRLARHKITPLEGGNSTNGYILTASTPELTKFIQAELGDTALFSKQPLYTFSRVKK